MDQHQLRLALLKISLVVSVITSWVFSSFVMQTRPEPEADLNPLTSLVRLPASLPAQLPESIPGVFGPQNKPAEPVRMDVVKVPCWDSPREQKHDVDSRWVRLVGRACQNDLPLDTVQVRNLRNGYVATVFNANRDNFTTDFIPLESGKNDLLIRFEPEAGVVMEKRVMFNR